jgi:hypothetical protein
LTERTGVIPTRSFQVGEMRGPAANKVAGWEWFSQWGADAEPLFQDLLRVLGPHEAAWRSCVDGGGDAGLSVVGEVGGIVVSSAEEAEERRISWGDGEFKPFFDGDRVGLYLTPEVVAFLAAVGARIATHIDVHLQDERPNWWEPDA